MSLGRPGWSTFRACGVKTVGVGELRIGGRRRGSKSGAQKAPPRRGEGQGYLGYLVGYLITAGLSLPPHYHRQGYCCDDCYYGDDDGYDGQTATGGCACGSGRASGAGRACSAIRTGRTSGASRTGGSGITLGADGTARSVRTGGSARPGGSGGTLGATGSGSAVRPGRAGRTGGTGGSRLRGGGQVKPGFQSAKFPHGMGLGGGHIVNVEGYTAGGAADIDLEFSSGGHRG